MTSGHPDLNGFPPSPGSPPSTLNPDDPATTPRTLARGTFDLDAFVPVLLRIENGRYYPPPHGQKLRWEISHLKYRTVADIQLLANGRLRAEEWMDVNAPFLKKKHPLHPEIDRPKFAQLCRRSLFAAVPSVSHRRSNLDNIDIKSYLERRLAIIDTLEKHVEYFKLMYSHFSSIGNRNLRGGVEAGKEVTLGRVIQSFECLIGNVSDASMLDVCFYGGINASMIHMDRHVMTDLFDLAVTLGEMRYGAFRPTREQAHTLLMAAQITPDIAKLPDQRMTDRRLAADHLIAAFCPGDLLSSLTEICCAVLSRRPIPETLTATRYECLP